MALAQQEFSEELDVPTHDPARLIGDLNIEKASDANTAVIAVGDDQKRLVESSTPLLAENDQGDKAPVDLELVDRQGRFEPRNPITDLSLPGTGQGEIKLGSQDPLGIGLESAGNTVGAARQLDGAVFYPDTDVDTDAIASPLGAGLELFTQLRSADSPETLRFPLSLPAGAELEQVDGGLEVRRGDDILWQIRPPEAWDARGVSVPVSMAASGSDVLISVSHRDRDYLYPLLVDPVYEDATYWSSNANLAGLGWWYQQAGVGTTRDDSRIGRYATFQYGACVPNYFACFGNPPYYAGLYVGARRSPQDYAYDEWGQYAYRVPGGTTNITRAVVGPRWYHREQPSPGVADAIRPFSRYTGLWNENSGRQCCDFGDPHGDGDPGTPVGSGYHQNGWYDVSIGQGPGDDWAVFGITTTQSICGGCLTDRTRRTFYAEGAYFELDDPEAPTVQNPPDPNAPSYWVEQYNGGSFTPIATDPGLGVKRISFYQVTPSLQLLDNDDNGCSGSHYSPCPAQWSPRHAFSYDTSSLPEGNNQYKVVGSDPLHDGERKWSIRIDRSPPQITGLTGPVSPNGTGTGSGLTVTATDGDGASLATQRSGVKSVEVFVDGDRAKVTSGGSGGEAITTQGCPVNSPDDPGSCPITAAFTLDASQYTTGLHQIKVVVKDQLGHETSQTWNTSFVGDQGAGITRLVHRVYNAYPSSESRYVDRDFTTTEDLNPKVSVPGYPNPLPALDWTAKTQIQTAVSAQDANAGIRNFVLNLPDPQNPNPTTFYNCTNKTCQQKRGELFGYATDRFPEGYSAGKITAYNGNVAPIDSRTWAFRTDFTDPTIQSTEYLARTPAPAGRGFSTTALQQPAPLQNPSQQTLSHFCAGTTEGLPVLIVPEVETELHVHARDGSYPNGSNGPLTAAERQSGVASVELQLGDPCEGPLKTYDSAAQPEIPDSCASVGSNCPMDPTFLLDASRFDPNVAQRAKLIVTDQVGHKTTQEFWVLVSPDMSAEALARLQGLLGGDTDRMGLEQYFQYDSTETGGQSSAHVNLDNGNLVWHKIPMTDPGRGLSTVANLDYNSADHGLLNANQVHLDNLTGQLNKSTAEVRSLLDSLGLSSVSIAQLDRIGLLPINDESAGNGFSLGISSLTRLNEPLAGNLLGTPAALFNPMQIKMRDVDGTSHTFKRDLNNPLAWKAAPGVDLHLRQFFDAKAILQGPPFNLQLPSNPTPQDLIDGLAHLSSPLNLGTIFSDNVAGLPAPLPADALRHIWAITRPDGVTYYYNLLGYPTDIKDRNGNVIRYEYEYYQPLTGQSCDPQVAGLPRLPSVSEILQLPLPLVCQARVNKVIDPAGTDQQTQQGGDPDAAARTVQVQYKSGGILARLGGDGTAGKIASITDHAARRTDFTYDNAGYLTDLTENAQDSTQARTTRFRYGGKTDAQGPPTTCNTPAESFGNGGGAGLYQQIVKGDSPSLLWRLGETSGTTAADSSGAGHNGTYQNAPTLGINGALSSGYDDDGAVDLNGTNQRVSSNYNPFTGSSVRTFEGWARRDTDTTRDALFGGTGVTENAPYLWLGVQGSSTNPPSTVTWQPSGNSGGGTQWDNAWPGTGQWVHWALVFNDAADTAELFVNGQSKGVRSIPTSYGLLSSSFQLGGWIGLNTLKDPFDGAMDEVAVYERGLSADELSAHYQAGLRAGITGADQLSAIQDPRGNWTCVDYDQQTALGEVLNTPLPTRAIIDRRQGTQPIATRKYTRYTYESPGSSNSATVKDNRDFNWQYDLDRNGRMTQMTNPLGTKTRLGWNGDNHVASFLRAADNMQYQSETDYTYNQNGLLTSQTEGIGAFISPVDTLASAGQRTTYLQYRDSNGTQESDLPATGDKDSDANFVSDLASLKRPRGNTYTYELDNGTNSDIGNVTKVTDPMGAVTKMTYDGTGELTRTDEQYDKDANNNPLFNTTTFSSFDLNGMPQVIVDPRGNDTVNDDPGGIQNSHRWVYGYDPVGNLTQVTDPRGSVAGGPAEQPQQFTTRLTYDRYDRVTDEHIPKCSTPGDTCSSGASDNDAQFIDHRYTYDKNGNKTSELNRGTGAQTSYAYGPTDRQTQETSPVGQVTNRAYNADDQLVGVESPRGAATATVGDFSTCYQHDAIGRVQAEVRQSGGTFGADTCSPTGQSLITSYVYDPRDNVLRTAYPRNNAPAGNDVANAINGAWNRAGYAQLYNLVDEDTFDAKIKSDGGTYSYEFTAHIFDPNGNETWTIEPRGWDSTPFGPRYTEHSTTRSYDADDHLTSVMDPEQDLTKYGRRADGKVTDVFSPRAGETPNDSADFRTHFTYYPTGELRARSIPYREGQYGIKTPGDASDPGQMTQTGVKGLGEIVYERDPVGNPVSIWDGRHPFQANFLRPTGCDPDATVPCNLDPRINNTFYDTGDLRGTNRPSWWNLDWSGGPQMPDAGNRFGAQGNAGAEADTQAPIDGPRLQERQGFTPNAQGQGGPDTGAGADNANPVAPGDFGRVDREQLPDMLPLANKTAFTYDDEMRLTNVQDAAGMQDKLAYDAAGRLTSKTWPFVPGQDITHTYTWDPNNNLAQYKDGASNEWDYSYDPFDRMICESAPGTGNPAVAADQVCNDNSQRELTRYAYDQNGNVLYRETPRGARTGDAAGADDNPAPDANDDFTFAFTYDTIDRLISETNPAGDRWTYGYDNEDNLTTETSPRNATTTTTYDGADRPTQIIDPLGNTTTIGYDADGNQTRIEAPGARTQLDSDNGNETHVTTQVFDGRDLLWKQITAGAVAQRSGSQLDSNPGTRTTITEYDPNGNLRRTVNPSGVSNGLPDVVDTGSNAVGPASDAAQNATVRTYTNDDLLKNVYMPWCNENDTAHPERCAEVDEDGDPTASGTQAPHKYVQGFSRNALGRIASIRSAHETDAETVPTTCYTYDRNGWIATSSEEPLNDPTGNGPICAGNKDKVAYTYDRQGNQTAWQFQDSAGADRGRTVQRTFQPNGLMSGRTAWESTAGGTGPKRQYTYAYDANGSLTQMVDVNQSRTTNIKRDPAEREQTINEQWATGRDTSFTYDHSGNVTERWTDWDPKTSDPADDVYKRATFQYDPMDRETEARINPIDAPAGQTNPPDRVVRTSYYPSGEISSRLEWRDAADLPGSNDPADHGVTVKENRAYDTDGRISEMKRFSSAGDETKDQSYLYNRNGDRVRDERGTYDYNARDQLTLWERGSGTKDPGSKVQYLIGGTGEIRKQNDTSSAGGATAGLTTYSYDDGNSFRLNSISSPDGTTTSYSYDPFNDVRTITASKPGTQSSTLTYTYDPFGRRIETQSSPSDPNTAGTYCYDGLDRRDVRWSNAAPNCGSASGTKREYSYIGTSEQLARESDAGGETKTYDYTSGGERLGQEKRPATSSPTFHFYAKDGQGGVEGIESNSGTLPDSAKYKYDPFGNLECGGNGDCESQLGSVDGDSKALKDNPFRYEGFYYDAGIKTYDMQARDYRPDARRFLSEDRFEQAGADLQLQSDPLTQNRYAFAGGNPVSTIEFDGHDPCSGTSHRCVNGLVVNKHGEEVGSPADLAPGLNRNLPGAPGTFGRASAAQQASLPPAALDPQVLNALAQILARRERVTPGPGCKNVPHPETCVAVGVVRPAEEPVGPARALNTLGGAICGATFHQVCGIGDEQSVAFREGDLPGALAGPGVELKGLGALAGLTRALLRAREATEAVNASRAAPEYFAGVRSASEHLQDLGFSRATRKEILESFDVSTLKIRRAGASEFGLRFFGRGSKALSPWLSPTFPGGNARSLLALPPFNTMEGIAQFQIAPNSLFLSGRAAANFGQPGGALQYYVPELENLIPAK
jgi:RHS repeat-associated protein